MHDIRLIRENPAAFDTGLARRGLAPAAAAILAIDTARRELVTRMQEAQARRNHASKAIGAAMAKADQATASALKAEVAALKEQLPARPSSCKSISFPPGPGISGTCRGPSFFAGRASTGSSIGALRAMAAP